MKTKHRGRALIAVLAASITALTACSAGENASSVRTAGDTDSLRIGLSGEPANFDLTKTSGAAIPQVLMNNVYEGLVSIDQDGRIVPKLASSWTVSPDGKTYDFQLHDGVTFSNGAAFTADDVKFSLERVKTSWAIFQKKMAVLDHVDVVSPTHARVVLSTPSNSWLYAMTSSVGLMFDPSGIADLANSPIGTGPYTIADRVVGDHITVAKRDGYWGNPPPIKTVTLRYFADATASTNALRAGDVDMLYNMQAPDLISQFKTNPQFRVIDGNSNGKVVLSLNNRIAPFDDIRVRQAFAYAIDRQAIIDGSSAGFGTALGEFASPNDPYFEDLTGLYPHDPTKAKALLAEAGAENLSVTFDVPTRPYATGAAEIIVSQLAEVGVKATIRSAEFPATWLDRVFTKHDYQMSIINQVEPRDFTTVLNDPTYYIGYDNSKIAPLIAAADAASQPDWVSGMKKVLEITSKDVPLVPLYLAPNLVVAASALRGIKANSVTESLDMTTLSWH